MRGTASWQTARRLRLSKQGEYRMRILAIYRHYWPDTPPYARILRSILEHLAINGHETSVYAAQPGYNDIHQAQQPWRETLGGVDIRRIRLLPERKRWRIARAINYAYFSLRSVMHAVVGRRYDLIIANTQPPVLMGCALRLIYMLTGTPYIYHCQDLHPESAALAGDLRRGWLYRLLERCDSAACRRAQRVVVLSQDMAEALAARGLSTANVSVINNPPLEIDASARPLLPPPLDEPVDAVRFLFAGNIGRFQGLERLVAAARLVAGRVPLQLIFMGEGVARRELIALAGDLLGRRIIFLPHQPLETAIAAMRVCDFGVVSLSANVYRFAYPSKSMMYLSAGCPLLALVEPESELAKTIEDYGLGYVAASRSVAHIAETIVKAVAGRGRWTAERRRQIEQTCRELYDQKRMLAAWDELIAGEPSSSTSDRERGAQAA
jgi:colanic acid biosynthesis glycosyl transferase WcaI